MQKLIASILLLAIIGQTFRQGFYYIDYLFDKAEYAKNCVNKARPQMHCNGQCQLMKKIQEQEKKEQQKAPEMKLAGKVEIIPAKDLQHCISSPGNIAINQYDNADEGNPVDHFSSVFHPPAAWFA